MSVSIRSTKAQLMAEIERLRALCEAQEQQLQRLRALCEAQEQQLRAASQPRQPRQAPGLSDSERRAKLEALKAFATKFRCPARLRDGAIELYSKKRRCWVAVPEGVQP